MKPKPIVWLSGSWNRPSCTLSHVRLPSDFPKRITERRSYLFFFLFSFLYFSSFCLVLTANTLFFRGFALWKLLPHFTFVFSYTNNKNKHNDDDDENSTNDSDSSYAKTPTRQTFMLTSTSTFKYLISYTCFL